MIDDINIETKRLLLRAMQLPDADSVFGYRSDPEIYKYQNWKPKSKEDLIKFIKEKISPVPDIPNTWHQLVIITKDRNEIIGDIGIHFTGKENLQAEVGFTLAAEHQGKGYAAEAVIEVMNYLFRELKKHRVIASVDPENEKSIKLLHRIGMRKEAHFRKSFWNGEKWVDDVIYAALNEEWLKH